MSNTSIRSINYTNVHYRHGSKQSQKYSKTPRQISMCQLLFWLLGIFEAEVCSAVCFVVFSRWGSSCRLRSGRKDLLGCGLPRGREGRGGWVQAERHPEPYSHRTGIIWGLQVICEWPVDLCLCEIEKKKKKTETQAHIMCPCSTVPSSRSILFAIMALKCPVSMSMTIKFLYIHYV